MWGTKSSALLRDSPSTTTDSLTTTIMNLNTAAIPLRPSPAGPALDVGLTPKQKARLHEVADLLLEIYQTLARMRRIKAAWIQPGPHDLTAHLPLYASLGLDQRVIYLYSIMPCLDPVASSASSACFFETCRFFDPRNEEHVRDAREFFHDEDDPLCELRPWTTALSQMGQYGAVVMYEARRHVVVFMDNNSTENNDRNLGNGRDEWSVSEEEDEEDEEDDEEGKKEEEEKDEEEAEHEDGEDDGEDDGEEEEEEEKEDEEAEEEHYFDYLDARAAGAVLRDILGWYRDLVDVPGCAADDEEWEGHDDALRAAYRKHGWPGENFDGDAFVVDRARVKPAAEIRFEPEKVLPSRLYLEYMVRESEKAEKAALAQGHEKLAATNDVDEEWVARWQIWNAERLTCESKDRLKRAEELIAQGRGRQKVEDLPLWEWDKVRRVLEYQQRSLGWLKERLENAGTLALPTSQEYIRYDEELIATLQKACVASQADAERLCPGRSISSLDPDESVDGLEMKTKLDYLAGNLRYTEHPCEDRFLHGIFPSPREDGNQWMAWAVFDGHAGWQTADLLEKQLLPVVRHHLSQAKAEISRPPAAVDAVRNAIMRAFVSLDDSITKAALDTPQSNEPLHEKVKLLAPGYAGSCALLSLYDPSSTTLHVACTGDSRAVLGRQKPDGTWEAVPLSVDQTGSNADEIARINREHPGEEDTIAKDGRVLGFAVSRAFGDGRLKWPLELQQTLWRKFNGPAPLTPRYDVRTPPYMTAEPVVTATRIDPDTPSFLIMASDGLWDNLSNQQAVDLVGKWLRMSGAREGNSEAAPPRYETLDFSHFRKGLVERRFTEARTTVQDENAAVHLVRNSLGGNHHELIASRLAFSAPFSRRLRDDITVQVVFFGHKALE
ncbi:hypothetical protein NEMBOFW57_004267 [Staphylotrichum longicolle]|uniref:PPM-type phosphatase domain-containing protein n=1 Tax=Staphylotrichum longicolle TaxID=669026 RepID=A0AAD4I3H0_9PEZI|nr:hypothetical protein NEMBOFW57_004267 [Staphylotrichum longicolle]